MGKAIAAQSACNAGDLGSFPDSERSPGEGNDNPLPYPCLEISMDRKAWQAIVHGDTKSWTRLSNYRWIEKPKEGNTAKLKVKSRTNRVEGEDRKSVAAITYINLKYQ